MKRFLKQYGAPVLVTTFCSIVAFVAIITSAHALSGYYPVTITDANGNQATVSAGGALTTTAVVSLPTPLPVSASGNFPVTAATTLPVTTPAPAPTIFPYSAPGSLLVCPSAAPAPINSTYIATCDSSGNQFVRGPVPSAFSTSLPAASATALPAAHTLISAYFVNSNASVEYCGLYNAAAITLGTTMPTDYAEIPANSSWPIYLSGSSGANYSTATIVACTTGYLGSTATAANTIGLFLKYF